MGWALVGSLLVPPGPLCAPWALVGRALVGQVQPTGASPCGPLGHPGPLWAGPLWDPLVPRCALVGRPLSAGPLKAGPSWAPLGPCGLPRALGRLGTCGPGPSGPSHCGPPFGPHGPGKGGPPGPLWAPVPGTDPTCFQLRPTFGLRACIIMCIYIHIYIYIHVRATGSCTPPRGIPP